MKIVIEVVATNMDSGHIAVHQETVDIEIESEQIKSFYIDKLTNSELLCPKKVGPILITRTITIL
ncbi:hypothetical protein vBAbaMPhT2_075 [Acinetobacter phage vB_AbaM_PhT2]|uniref:Uncharacterized protein n=2 Tax=Hadassahvirus TaxID=2842716 RepID=A0A6B9SXP9_9CAUD|nr:hypothetical protein HYP74_gp091 [Acinetobacter phage AbTZA1]YP_009887095.1 hypothetical protein HYQ24_gp075 [Acinetobacter phage vB_AbaM_PhT2]QQM13742.1 hypothetical protein CPT_Maestro_008 [Acinetobacter phage Maestro]QQM18500.1 hypothetical protein CPT_Morttis_007 [Acinetobacter phage Morttis]UQS94082.1 hypothetical protein ABNavy71_005 [Acinetobacter phage AB-Navy71]AZU98757.1 hypothetical protein [Acinetobacter phage AbTZA1]QHJ75687.1 hypothetical protein vBAbaMPhT2_075 [Acinetobacter